MSSIDKYMGDIACQYDSRVRVRNTSITKGYGGCNGEIKFYIGNECILTIPDRYGVIRDEEKEQIRRAISAYKQRERSENERLRREEEARRRREEEERRRREEEERRRRLEAERVAAYNKLVSTTSAGMRSLDSALEVARNTAQRLENDLDQTARMLGQTSYDVSTVRARLDAMKTEQSKRLKSLQEEHRQKRAQLEQLHGSANYLSTEQYKERQKQANAVTARLTAAEFDGQGAESMREYVKELLDLHAKLRAQRELFTKDVQRGASSAEIARIAIERIDKADKTSLQQIKTVLQQLETAHKDIEKCDSDSQLFAIGEALRNAPAAVHVEREFVPTQSTYGSIDYAQKCRDEAEQLRRQYEALKEKELTTITASELKYVEEILQQVDVGTANSAMHNTLKEAISYLQVVHTDDSLDENRRIFEDYTQLKRELAAAGIAAEKLDAANYEAQRERLIEQLCARQAEIEVEEDAEEIADKRSMLSLGVCSAFANEGLYLITGRVSESGISEELVFAIPGVEDAVIKAEITSSDLHWYVCGTAQQGKAAPSAERVMQIVSVFERDGKINRVLTALSQSLQIHQGEITNAVDADSEGALEAIAANGVFNLDQKLYSADGREMTAGERMRNLASEYAQEAERNRAQYAGADTAAGTPIPPQEDRLPDIDKKFLRSKKEAARVRVPKMSNTRGKTSALRAMYKK